MSVLSRPLYAGGRVRIVPGSVKNSVSGGGRGGGGRVGYGILGGASCRPSGRSVEARGTSKGYRSGGISSRARTGPGARSPHQEGSGPPGVPGAPARPAPPAREARDPALGRHAGCPGPGQPAPRPLENPQAPAPKRPVRPRLRRPERGPGPLDRRGGRGALRAAGRRWPPGRARAGRRPLPRRRPTRAARVEVPSPANGDPAPGSIANLPSTAAVPAPEAPPPTNLPAPTSDLIGRATALAEVTEVLGAHRLVTLIGAGGIGKTRLGLEVARQQLPSFADGVWVAELAPLSDPGLVPVTVAVALGLTLAAAAESPERVASALGGKRLLLVLDNLRARDRGGGAHGRGAAARRSARPRAGDQPGAAARAGGVRLWSALARGARGGNRGSRRPAGRGRGQAVRGAGACGGATLLARRPHRGDHGRDLSAPRRHPARDRARGGPDRHARSGRARRPAGRSVSAAHWRPPDRAAAAPDAAGHARLELRAAPRDRAHGPASPGHLRRRFHAGGGERRRDGGRPRRARGR